MRKGLDATSGAQFATDCHYGQEGFFICTDPLNCRPIFFFCYTRLMSKEGNVTWQRAFKKRLLNTIFYFSFSVSRINS